MWQLISPLTAVLLATAYFVIANACVCYVGQEPNSIKGDSSLQLLPDQNPCECTELRPGGVNTKQQAKPYEVTFGNDGHPEDWTEMDCISDPPTTPTATFFATVTLDDRSGMRIPPILSGQSFQSYPVSFEFDLQSSTNYLIEIYTLNSAGFNQLCHVVLDRLAHTMRTSGQYNITTQDLPEDFDGSSHYVVTINHAILQFGRLGEPTALECRDTAVDNSDITSIEIFVEKHTTIGFYRASASLPRSYFQQ